MTMDNSIIVDDDFDPTNPEDQALYAHERVHELESGGSDHPNDLHDAEEVAARAVERMVLHRRASGESFGNIMRDVSDASSRTSEAASAATPSGVRRPGGAAGAYAALRASGKTHQQIVDMLARKVIAALAERGRMEEIRAVSIKSI